MVYVIFPDNKWIKRWDAFILFLLACLLFNIPYEIGVSAGTQIASNVWYFGILVFVDALFMVDTFLQFWRAYRSRSGHLVFNLRKIRLRYLSSYFIPNLISNAPGNLIFFHYARAEYVKHGGFNESNFPHMVLIKLLDIIKFTRFLRWNEVVKSSGILVEMEQKINTQYLVLIKHTVVLLTVSHWFACIWVFIALYQAEGMDDKLREVPNWLGIWYSENGEEGTMSPLVAGNHRERYIIALFWSIQTITSIGYGNIAPITTLEWLAGSVIQLAAALVWANTIAGLVGVSEGLSRKTSNVVTRIDAANHLMNNFEDHLEQNMDGDLHSSETEELRGLIKSYIQQQYVKSEGMTSLRQLSDIYPILRTLSPQMCQMSSFMLLKKELDCVPYLSYQFLDINEQGLVAKECYVLELAPLEMIDLAKGIEGIGRGIFVFAQGVGMGYKNGSRNMGSRILSAGSIFGAEEVLVENGHPGGGGKIHLLTYSKIIFIPRDLVLISLDRNRRAWKSKARWMYLEAVLFAFSRSIKNLRHS